MKPCYLPFLLIIFLMSFVSCSQPKETLSDSDRKLAEELAFDTELFSDLRKHTDSTFRMTEGNPDAELGFKDPANYQRFKEKKVGGLSFDVPEKLTLPILADLHDKYKAKGYLIYVSESNSGYKPDEMTVLKTTDMFDAIRFEGTNGINHDIFTEDIIEKLTGWNSQFGLDIFAASYDLVQAYYLKVPSPAKPHAEETYAFCPDVVDQGTGTVEELEKQITQSRQLYLWWD
jgi:hypothetical protein